MDEQKELEKLMDKFFEMDQLDVPSANFTSEVIKEIEAREKEKLTYRPLLPKWVFFGIGVLVTVFVYVVLRFTETSTPQTDYLNSIDFSVTWLSEGVSNLNLSSSLVYGILALGLMICLQARLLNGFLNRTNQFA